MSLYETRSLHRRRLPAPGLGRPQHAQHRHVVCSREQHIHRNRHVVRRGRRVPAERQAVVLRDAESVQGGRPHSSRVTDNKRGVVPIVREFPPCSERVQLAVPDLWVRFVAMRCSVDEHGQFPAEEYPRFCERFLG